jgi:hypothetical protein
MKIAHHQLPHAFLVALWGFMSPKSNTSKFSLNLDGTICPVPNKSVKLSRFFFSFFLGRAEL